MTCLPRVILTQHTTIIIREQANPSHLIWAHYGKISWVNKFSVQILLEIKQTQICVLHYICSPIRFTKWFLMSKFIQHLCELYMFRTSSVHHQECFVQAVFADFGMWSYCAYYSTRPAVTNGWKCRVARVLPHTKVCEYSLYKTLLMMDRWGPKHVELTKSAE